jgi:hypothetical protein
MEKLGLGDPALDADKQSVLDSALLAVFDIDDVHAQLVEPDPERDWNVGLQVIKLLVDAGAQVNAHQTHISHTPLHFALQ